MLFSSFTGFAQLGLFSIAGLIAAAATTRFVLPHLMPRGFFARGAEPLARPLFFLIRHRRAARGGVAVALLAAILALLLHRGGMWDGNLLDLSPIPAAAQQLDQGLRHDARRAPTSAISPSSKPPSEQAALQQSEALAPMLNGLVVGPPTRRLRRCRARILPSEQTQRQRQAALPDAATLHANFAQAAAGLPFNAAGFRAIFHRCRGSQNGTLAYPRQPAPGFGAAIQLPAGPPRRRLGGDGAAATMSPTRPPSPSTLAAAGPPGIAFVDLNQESDRLLQQISRTRR